MWYYTAGDISSLPHLVINLYPEACGLNSDWNYSILSFLRSRKSIFLNAAASDCQTQQVSSFKQISCSIWLKKKKKAIKMQAGKQ